MAHRITVGEEWPRTDVARNGTFAQRVSEVWISAAQLVSTQGSPALASGSAETWYTLPDSATASVGTSLQLPAEWATFDVEVHWTQFSSGVGQVVRWQYEEGQPGVGDIYTGTTTIGAVSATALADGTTTRTTIAATRAITAGKHLRLSLTRLGGDGADTLAGAAYLLGVKVKAASFLA